jgi:hypothetical protein
MGVFLPLNRVRHPVGNMESLPLEEFKDRQIRGLIHVDVLEAAVRVVQRPLFSSDDGL